MLMITEKRSEDVLAFKLAGTLSGDWAVEFNRCWRDAISSMEPSRVIVDLTEVTFVDEHGKEILTLMMSEGAALIASDILMRSIVDEITKETTIA